MKIVSWNLRNISLNKLGNAFSPTFNAYGLGNNVLDYMVGLVMGTNRWNAIPNLSTNPADVFVMIELKTGGSQKGRAVSGNCLPALNAVTAALNTLVGLRYPGNPNPPYQYNYAVPLVIGRNETVGIIFNTVSLALVATNAFRNTTNNNWINPRSPFGAQFRIIANNAVFQVVGLHAPPPKGGAALKYRPPIDYCRLLPTTAPAALANTFFMGDFNCNPGSTYTNGGGAAVSPFTGLAGFTTQIPNGTLSSVRTKVANAYAPPANYLSDAYDNIIYNDPIPVANVHQLVVDTIGGARNMNVVPIVYANLTGVLNAYNKVSDHLPVAMEW
ncbi:exonuclease/endonuclease/phosphatase family protein [Mucilaginibacter xinganensis]|uniref:Endonuclease/Exonuclease/phosphatase family protein n=1 Tax=Mucilaginibacter xinganensis TaxID=1234841 RepID=A0A223NV91_9SPHI|nr:hypothetical protein [Mucilaginibacter xinganensis]ASU33548.1 hypothetical protein MuYL_1652 [Mucilaginibacter xinganensis]